MNKLKNILGWIGLISFAVIMGYMIFEPFYDLVKEHGIKGFFIGIISYSIMFVGFFFLNRFLNWCWKQTFKS